MALDAAREGRPPYQLADCCIMHEQLRDRVADAELNGAMLNPWHATQMEIEMTTIDAIHFVSDKDLANADIFSGFGIGAGWVFTSAPPRLLKRQTLMALTRTREAA